MKEVFNEFNKLIVELRKIVEFPFSKELHGIESRNYKFQISTAMLLAGVFYEIYNSNKIIIENILSNEQYLKDFHQILVHNIKSSYLEDSSYKSSSTDSKEMSKLVQQIVHNVKNYHDLNSYS